MCQNQSGSISMAEEIKSCLFPTLLNVDDTVLFNMAQELKRA